MLACFYILIFALQLFLLIRCFRRRFGWGKLLVLNLGALVLAGGMMWYFDGLSKSVAMAGWAYFAEVFYSICACGGFFLLTLISAIGKLLSATKDK